MSQTRPPDQAPGLLTLANPPILLSAAVEAVAGAYLAGAPFIGAEPLGVAIASALLFTAGNAFAYYFARVAPSAGRQEAEPGGIATANAWRLGWITLLLGAALPALFGQMAVLMSIGVALLLVLNAAATREVWGAGFLTMGAARGLNLLLGIAVRHEMLGRYAGAVIPVILLVVGWELMRHSRQPGAPPTTTFFSLAHVAAAIAVLLYLSSSQFNYRLDALPFLIATVALGLPRFIVASQDPRRPAAAAAVQFGFLALTMLAATLAAGYAGLRAGVLIVLLGTTVYQALKAWPIPLVTEPR
jgi:4-hydroxybenzoate polyprenyltransferase